MFASTKNPDQQITRLDYAPISSNSTLRRWRVRFISILSLLLPLSAIWWGRPIFDRIKLLYWQHQCLTYAMKSGTPLWRADGSAAEMPRCWSTFLTAIEGSSSYRAIAYSGERTSSNGHRRLVAVLVSSAGTNGFVGLNGIAIVEASVGEMAHEGGAQSPPQGSLQSVAAQEITASVSDVANPSHFTIEWKNADGNHIIDGWLQDDDAVLLQERHLTAISSSAAGK